MTAMLDDPPGGAATGSGGPATAEARLEQLAPGYLAKVRSAAAALAVDATGSSGGLGVELAAVRDASRFDLDVPTASSSPAGRYLKTGVKRATGWYLRYLTAQLGTFAAAVSSMGDAMASRIELLEVTDGEAAAQLAELRRRVERLETGSAATVDTPGGPPGVPAGEAPTGVSEPAGPGPAGPGPAGPGPAGPGPAGPGPTGPEPGFTGW